MALTQPPILAGSAEHQAQQLRSYLYQISRELNIALESVGKESVQEEVEKQLSKAAASGGTIDTELQGQAGILKSLIVKSADTVKAYTDQLVSSLSDEYVAQSDFGTFKENVDGAITQSAGGVTQYINTQTAITSALLPLNQYVTYTNGYIRQGIVGYDGTTPIIGIAIGQDIQETGTQTIDGREYSIIDKRSNMSIWTTEKLSFYVNGVEQAYVGNGAFYAKDIVVNGRMLFGDDWQITSDSTYGLTLRWIGA